MKRLRKICPVLLILCWATSLFAQQSGKIENGFNVSLFPKITFTYHSYSPDSLSASDFWHLTEDGTDRKFQVKKLPSDTTSAATPQTILILWEDMAYNGSEQFSFTKNTLSGFFNTANITGTDRFAVAAFNRRGNTSSALTDLTDGFSNNIPEIDNVICRYKQSAKHYPEYPNRSDLYTAIREGLDRLAAVQGVKAIIVFTSGRPMKNSGADSEAQVLLKAQRLHIPVYIFQYYFKSGVASEAENFARSTGGTFSSYTDADLARQELTLLYPQISRRYRGHDYEITFTSGAGRGAEARMISLSVCGDEIQQQLLPPPHTIRSWVESHRWIVIISVIVVILVTILFVVLICRTKRSATESRRNIAKLEQRYIKDQAAAEEYRHNSEQQLRQQQAEEMQQAKADRLNRLMAAKNIYPRLKCRAGAESFTVEITGPTTRIGREADNDIVLNDKKVSRHHADIVFTGSQFEIIDRGSTNRVIVNGMFVERAILKSGDIIGLGESVITFI